MAFRGHRVLIIASTTAYQTDDLIAAARALDLEPVVAADRCHVLAELWPEGAIPLDFGDPAGAAGAIAARAEDAPIAGVVPTDERTAVIAAHVARALDLPYNAPEALRKAADKLVFRRALAAAGLPHPRFCAHPVEGDLADVGGALGFPVVIKPLHLSASRGVMRADSAEELKERARRLARLLADPEVAGRDPEAARTILVERYLPGDEVAFEGILEAGSLSELAIFDKPDPLEGPFFPETIYVSPTRLCERRRAAIRDAVSAAARAIGLGEGPVHAEVRLTEKGPVVLELAGRSIGGLCGRTLRYGAGISVEEAVVGHAVGGDVDSLRRPAAPAAGVMMLPVPEAGVLREVEGVADATAVPGVVEVEITARPGDILVPLPEGRTYLGFLFATGQDPEAVTASLRRSTAALRPRIAKRL